MTTPTPRDPKAERARKQAARKIAELTSVPPPEPSPLSSERTFEVKLGRVFTNENIKLFRITVPKGSRVTFGPVSPAHGGCNYLRIYEGTSQIAVFDNVESFYDVSLPLTFPTIEVETKSKLKGLDTEAASSAKLTWWSAPPTKEKS